MVLSIDNYQRLDALPYSLWQNTSWLKIANSTLLKAAQHGLWFGSFLVLVLNENWSWVSRKGQGTASKSAPSPCPLKQFRVLRVGKRSEVKPNPSVFPAHLIHHHRGLNSEFRDLLHLDNKMSMQLNDWNHSRFQGVLFQEFKGGRFCKDSLCRRGPRRAGRRGASDGRKRTNFNVFWKTSKKGPAPFCQPMSNLLMTPKGWPLTIRVSRFFHKVWTLLHTVYPRFIGMESP